MEILGKEKQLMVTTSVAVFAWGPGGGTRGSLGVTGMFCVSTVMVIPARSFVRTCRAVSTPEVCAYQVRRSFLDVSY